jgi:hypothetical protein
LDRTVEEGMSISKEVGAPSCRYRRTHLVRHSILHLRD